MFSTKKISPTRISRIRMQGYFHKNDQDIKALAIGNRFAYQLCTILLAIGVVSSSIPILSAMLTIAFFSILLPNHVFDYIYNYILAAKLNRPKLPPRSKQLKFACTIATLCIGTTIYLLYAEMYIAGMIMGSMLIGVATLVSTIDYCIPSIIYNALFLKRSNIHF